MHNSNKIAKNSMSRNVVWLGPEDDVRLAYELMESEEFRHIPIVENNSVIGVISDRDLLRIESRDSNNNLVLPDLTVSQIMTDMPITCFERSKISDIADTMVDKKIDCLPVVSPTMELKGLVTSSDLLALLSNSDQHLFESIIPFKYQVREASYYL